MKTRPSNRRPSGAPPPPMSAGERGQEFQARLPSSLRWLPEFRMHDLEATRLVLRGGSVLDWHRLNFQNEAEARALLQNHELNLNDPRDLEFIEHVRDEAVGYLRRHFNFAVPRPVEQAGILDLLMIASGKGHRQLCACTILKTIHIINHMRARELLFRLPVSDKDVFHLVEEKVYRVVGAMLSGGFPVTEFIGGRKNLDSTYTKLLSKNTATASALYDKLRFRIVTRTKEDILPILLYLTEHLFPYNYVVPGESKNSLFHFRSFCDAHPELSQLTPFFQGEVDDALAAGDNRFSAQSYRVIHFVTDVPVRVPDAIREAAPPGSESLGPIVYVLCEFQMLDAETDAANEIGESSHDAYKRRQKDAVFRRLRLGARPSRTPDGEASPDQDPVEIPENPPVPGISGEDSDFHAD